jgi:signal transduction histidine kinase
MGLKTTNGNIINMVKWEGAVFFILVVCITLAHLYMYASDRRKSQSISLFFASLTHELKTPLASIKLQSQVLSEILDDIELIETDREKVIKYVDRLHDSSFKLEHELDKHLQLSRVERDGVLNFKEIDLNSSLKSIAKDFKEIELNIISDDDYFVSADEFALNIILRNIFENTQRHNKSDKKELTASIKSINNKIHITFKDNGTSFNGDLKRLGTLFYKYDSPKGSGLGLYMIKKLVLKMSGKTFFKNEDGLQITMVLKENE